ncbi:hypothetical protein DVH24_008097, partial [Malus domestica]
RYHDCHPTDPIGCSSITVLGRSLCRIPLCLNVHMSQLITRRWSVTNASPALSASTAPPMSAPLIQEPTPLAEATSTASQVPVSSTSSVSVQPLSARRPHRCRREPEPSDHTSSASRVEGEASQPGTFFFNSHYVGEQMEAQLRVQSEEVRTYAATVRDLVRAIQTAGLQVSLPAPHLDPPSISEPPHPPDTQ